MTLTTFLWVMCLLTAAQANDLESLREEKRLIAEVRSQYHHRLQITHSFIGGA